MKAVCPDEPGHTGGTETLCSDPDENPPLVEALVALQKVGGVLVVRVQAALLPVDDRRRGRLPDIPVLAAAGAQDHGVACSVAVQAGVRLGMHDTSAVDEPE